VVVGEDMERRGFCINDAQVKTMMQKNGQPRLTGKKTLPLRQNEEEVNVRTYCNLFLFTLRCNLD